MENTHDFAAALYVELSELVTSKVDGIKWADLWKNQVGFLEKEDPFPSPAIFFAFRSNDMKDMGQKVQDVNMQVDCYLFYETFADTFHGSYNREAALSFLNAVGQLNSALHGSVGNNYTSMRRIAFNQEETGNAGHLYRITYECKCIDYSAHETPGEGSFKDVAVDKFIIEP